jgi:transcriptional regulator with XRE-family HTH domain
MGNRTRQYSAQNLLTIDGAALTRARIKSQLSMEDLVQGFPGCNKSTISRWEQGVLVPSSERLFALVELLGTYDFVRLNGKTVLTKEEIEVVRKLREG